MTSPNEYLSYIHARLIADKKDYTHEFVLKLDPVNQEKSYIRYDRWVIHMANSNLYISDGTLKNKLFAPNGLKGLFVILRCYDNLNKVDE